MRFQYCKVWLFVFVLPLSETGDLGETVTPLRGKNTSSLLTEECETSSSSPSSQGQDGAVLRVCQFLYPGTPHHMWWDALQDGSPPPTLSQQVLRDTGGK